VLIDKSTFNAGPHPDNIKRVGEKRAECASEGSRSDLGQQPHLMLRVLIGSTDDPTN
jgi:hypothetical protein